LDDNLGLDFAEAAFARQRTVISAEVRARMQHLLDRCRTLSEGQPNDVLARIAIVFEGRGV
jgi:hypothetical protein